MSAPARTLWRHVLDLITPEHCRVCTLPAAAPLCAPCADQIRLRTPRCTQCAEPLSAAALDKRCGRCQVAAPPWQRLWVGASYSFPVDALIAALKYQGRTGVAPALAAVLPTPHQLLRDDGVCVVPVPLHWRRLRQRRYNQAELIARAFSSRAGLRCRPRWLRRCRATQSQVDLSLTERHENVKGAFRAHRRVQGATVCLLDDVMTTGATLTAAADALHAAGVGAVYCLVVASGRSTAQA